MNKKVNSDKIISNRLFIISCMICILLGILFHFVYKLLGKPFIIGLFLPVNESIWEHLKLVLVPITLFGIMYSMIYKNNESKLNNFWFYTSISIAISMVIISVVYYTYLLIFKEASSFFNISLYTISMCISFYCIYVNMKKQYVTSDDKNKNSTGILIITCMFLIFIVFTIYPPRLEFFKDPVNNTFGIYML